MNQVGGGLVWCRSCLHWLADKDSLRSQILVAMGSLAYKVGNESGSGWFGTPFSTCLLQCVANREFLIVRYGTTLVLSYVQIPDIPLIEYG